MNQRAKKGKQTKRNEDNLRDLWDNVKCPNIQSMGVLEEEDKKKDHEKILEIRVENFPNMGKKIIAHVQETQRVPNKINPRQNTPTCINQINEGQTQRTNIKSSKGKPTYNTEGDSHMDNN